MAASMHDVLALEELGWCLSVVMGCLHSVLRRLSASVPSVELVTSQAGLQGSTEEVLQRVSALESSVEALVTSVAGLQGSAEEVLQRVSASESTVEALVAYVAGLQGSVEEVVKKTSVASEGLVRLATHQANLRTTYL